jgi:hypothetical protein
MRSTARAKFASAAWPSSVETSWRARTGAYGDGDGEAAARERENAAKAAPPARTRRRETRMQLPPSEIASVAARRAERKPLARVERRLYRARMAARARTIDIVLDKDAELARVEKIARVLDSEFVIPGTGVRYGLDPLLGLIPGVGDLIGFLIGVYIIHRLDRLEMSGWTRFRMFWNITVDLLGGLFPVIGDIFDVAFKANLKNVELARRALARQRKMIG